MTKGLTLIVSCIIFIACNNDSKNQEDLLNINYDQISFSHNIFDLQDEIKLTVENEKENVAVKIKEKNGFFELKTKKKSTFLSKKSFNLFQIKDSSIFKDFAKVNIAQSILADQNLIGLKSKLLSVKVEGQIHEMFFQEGFDKRIIESNNNREGILFTYGTGVNIEYNPTDIEDDQLAKSINSRIKNWLDKTTETECLIDIKKAGKFLSIYESLHLNEIANLNFSYYLNPVSNLIEPFIYLKDIKDQDQLSAAFTIEKLIQDHKGLDSTSIQEIEKGIKEHKLNNLAPVFEPIKKQLQNIKLATCYPTETFLKYFIEKDDIFVLKSKKIELTEPLILPTGHKIQFNPGDEINILKNGFVLSFSPVSMLGTKDNPISIYSSDTLGSGFHVINAGSGSKLNYVNFKGLSNLNYEAWKLPSAVTFYESPVEINNCSFDKNNCEDAINIFRSTPYVFANSTISNTFSDAFDADFSDGVITGCRFINSGNDGVDISGSNITIENTTFKNISDKALSAGEKSNMKVDSIHIDGASLAITSKDLSSVKISNSTIVNSEVIYCAFQKKAEFGPSSIQAESVTYKNFKEENLIEEGSKLKVDGEKIHNYRDDVKKYLYGNEYGKETVK